MSLPLRHVETSPNLPARADVVVGQAQGQFHGQLNAGVGQSGRRPLPPSLGEFSTVGNMMGGLIGGSLMIEGLFARLMHMSLYKMHELALHGVVKVSLDTLARLITRRTEPHVKLH